MGKTIQGVKFQGRYKVKDLINTESDDYIDTGSEAVLTVRGIVPADTGDLAAFGETVAKIEKIKKDFAEKGDLIGDFTTKIGNFIVNDDGTEDEAPEDAGTEENADDMDDGNVTE